MDNKHWVDNHSAPAVNGYEHFLTKPSNCRPDLSYQLNKLLEKDGEYLVINTALEESTLWERQVQLFEHDEFVRDNIQEDDILIISCGGNDIALKPKKMTIFKMAVVMYLNTESWIKNGTAFGFPYFVDMFFKPNVQLHQRRDIKEKTKAYNCFDIILFR